MLKYSGGHKVGKGTYWDLSNGGRIDIPNEGVLPGDKNSTYTRFPPSVMLLLGPILGLLYVIFLPFIAIAMMISLLAEKIFKGMWNIASFGWRPTEAYLAGKRKGKKKNDKTTDSS